MREIVSCAALMQATNMQVDVNKVYVTLSSVILAFAFVFGNNIRNLYESVIFLFVVHPYDVGDVLLIDGVWHQVCACIRMSAAGQHLEPLWMPSQASCYLALCAVQDHSC